jgi:predicted dienelactone hydrolase
MKRFSTPSHVGFAGFALGGLTLCALSVAPIDARQSPQASAPPAAQTAKVMHEFRGIKLGLKQAQVQAALGKPESASAEREEYKLGDEDSLTVHYDNGAVRAIQLYFSNPKNAPAWAEVVGDAEVVENANGAKHARVVVRAENFWVSMFQNKDRSVTTITISR